MTKRGKYIVIEGTDGTGKSTQAERIAARLEERGFETVQFHEPDGVEIASHIRTVIKDGSLARSAFTNVLLFSAARRENWLQIGKPFLARGGWIVSARDYTSTLVYQGLGEGLPLEDVERITQQATDDEYMNPDYRVILDINDEAERARRISERGMLENPDTFESRDDDFQQRIIQGYRKIAALKNIPVVSANQPINAITDEIWDIIAPGL